jgi:DNA recombination protein RmuC
MMNYLLVALVALASGVALGIVLSRARESGLRLRLAALEAESSTRTGELRELRSQADTLTSDKQRAEQEVAVLNERLLQERRGAAEKLELLSNASQELQNAFHRLAGEALANNNQSFLQLAKTSLESFHKQAEGGLAARETAIAGLVKPIEQSLKSVEEQVKSLETQRVDAYSALRQQIVSLSGTQEQLKLETAKLVQALRAPHVRGRWGEIQLRRAVELAGMLDHCDFVEQSSVETDNGRLRPDMIIRLPGGKQIVVDSKAPLEAYLKALEATDEDARRAFMMAHARQIREHMAGLSSKKYWEQFACSPDFVVMFLPGEVFFSAALEHAPDLIEAGVEEKVIPASPTTLIALLRAVHFGWRQEMLAENANKISELGKRLYDSLCTMAGHLEKLGGNLDRSVKSYNETIGSLERNVLVGGRRFRELGVASSGEIAEAKQIGNVPRLLQSADWKPALEEEVEIVKG